MENVPEKEKEFTFIPQPEIDLLTPEQKKIALDYQEQISKTNLTIAAILAATEDFKKKYNSQLSAFPAHPYDKYKQMYLDPSKPTLTIEQIPYPRCYSPLTLMSQITSISEVYSERLLTQVPYLSTGNPKAGQRAGGCNP